MNPLKQLYHFKTHTTLMRSYWSLPVYYDKEIVISVSNKKKFKKIKVLKNNSKWAQKHAHVRSGNIEPLKWFTRLVSVHLIKSQFFFDKNYVFIFGINSNRTRGVELEKRLWATNQLYVSFRTRSINWDIIKRQPFDLSNLINLFKTRENNPIQLLFPVVKSAKM